ncbi:zinc finger protein [Macleaya cordata]|uniref:Zinc finger protein n=1 Tax=Macleaya cordata TaxID=56857 RepID=A0A200QMA2_MACCD|nr:zinc finger protein [Macleaya cordata]
MGGGNESKMCAKCIAGENTCQICNLTSHTAPSCPFIYTKCKQYKCNGFRKLFISGTDKNPGRIFLKCQDECCENFQWLDDAIRECFGGVGSSSLPQQHRSKLSCFGCGENDHWKRDCPWLGSPCRDDDCEGVRDVKISRWAGHEGERYVQCSKCNDTQWLRTAKDSVTTKETNKSNTVGARIVIETTLEYLCKNLNLSVKK